MALTRTLAQLAASARQCADVEAVTDRFPDAEVYDYVNRGLGALYRLLTQASPSLRFLASTTVTTSRAQGTYALPADFRSLVSVELTGDGHKSWLQDYEFCQRPQLTDTSYPSTGRPLYYRLQGSNFELLPVPMTAYTALVWYVPTAPQLTSTGQTVDVVDRLDDYVVWYAAREITFKSKDWDAHDRLSQKLTELEGQVYVLARSYDLASPRRVTDLSYASTRYGRRMHWRR